MKISVISAEVRLGHDPGKSTRSSDTTPTRISPIPMAVTHPGVEF
jgi:hypothetical protein